jgi:hypothetical protein
MTIGQPFAIFRLTARTITATLSRQSVVTRTELAAGVDTNDFGVARHRWISVSPLHI